MRARAMAAGVGLALAALAVPGAAQDTAAQLVDSLLQTGKTMAEGKGMKAFGSVSRGALQQGGTVSVTVDLAAGRNYSAIGVCDTDCGDLNLTLIDPAGAKVASDVLADDTPVLTAAARSSGTYRLQVDMVKCTAKQCRYGVELFVG